MEKPTQWFSKRGVFKNQNLIFIEMPKSKLSPKTILKSLRGSDWSN